MSTIVADVTGARRKVKVLKAVPTACGRLLARWGAETVKFVIRYSDSVFSKGRNRRTGHLRRNVGFEVQESALLGATRVTVGTGVGQAKEVIYARIQDKGGTTHPNVTQRMRAWAWWMYRETKDKKYLGIAITHKARLDVKIPASGWFTIPTEYRTSILRGYLKDSLLPEAEKGVD